MKYELIKCNNDTNKLQFIKSHKTQLPVLIKSKFVILLPDRNKFVSMLLTLHIKNED